MPLYGTNFVSLIKNQAINGIKNFLQNVGIGVSNPQANLHIDGGNATASSIKFTAGNTTEQTATDGFNIGISNTGAAEIKQLENNNLSFFTNNINRLGITGAGVSTFAGIVNISDTTASISSTTGALVVSGGIGIAGNSYFNGNLIANFFRSNSNIVCNNTIYLNTALQSFDALGINTSAADLNIKTGQSTGNANSGNLIFSTTIPGSSGSSSQNWQERARFNGNTGNLLINATIDDNINKLQVNGSIKANLVTDTTVFSVSQFNGVRNLSFGSSGLICDTVATLGRSSRIGGALLEISTASAGLIGVIVQGVSGQSTDLQQWRDSNNNTLAKVDNLGRFFAQNITGTVITGSQFRLSASNIAPSSSSDIGTVGEIKIDSNYIYYCVATNSWKRAALTVW